MRTCLKRAVLVAFLVAAPLVVVAAPSAAATNVLSGDPSEPFQRIEYTYDSSCSTFQSEEIPSPDQTFQNGPGTPPAGKGSLAMDSSSSGDLELFRSALWDGTKLADLTELKYSTYLKTAGAQPQYLRLHVDKDGDGDLDETLLFIPANNDQQQTVTTNSWQTWDAFTGRLNVNSDTGPGGATTLADYVAANPNAKIIRSFDPAPQDPDVAGGVSFILYCNIYNGATYSSNLDRIIIGVSGASDTFDLEPTSAQPSATITPSSGGEGTKITFTGSECYERGNVYLFRGDTQVASSTGVVPSGGTFTTTVTVPADSDPSAVYTVRATCSDSPTGTPEFSYPNQAFDVTPTPAMQSGGNGYRMVAADGGIFTFGQRNFHGSTGSLKLNKPIVGGATDVSDYDGYWIVASDGGVFTFGAPFHGSLGHRILTSPAVEIEPTATGDGYWIVQADGTVTPFGAAKFFGDMRGKNLNQPIIGMSVAPDGQGYWLVGQDGGIFTFGSAGFFGSTGDRKLNAPVIDLAPMPDGNGYYLVAKDGGVFTFGTALFKGSTGSMKLNQPVIAMLVAPNGTGYWLAASDGGIFTFGNVDFLGSMGGTRLNAPVLDLIN